MTIVKEGLMKELFENWKVAYLAKGGRITPHEEEMFNDFFKWLEWKEAENKKALCEYCNRVHDRRIICRARMTTRTK